MRGSPWTWLMVTVGVLGGAAAVGAQSPADRSAIEALRAELAGVTDSAALLRREAAGIERAKADRDNPLMHIELGFVAYRLGEVTAARQHYDDAAGEFEWASELRPEWPYPWYGLGLAELALGEHPSIAIENIRQALGKDFLSKAAAAFARATEADPGFAQAVIDLADAARRQRIRQRLDVAQRALRAAAATAAGALPALQLARGRVEREMGEGDSALAAFREYVTVGGDEGVGRLEQARTLFYLRRPKQATAAYYAGAGAAGSDSGRAGYRADIAWIATPEDLQAFDGTADTALAEWLHRFWERRDAEDVRAPGERIAEHYRRYFYAWRHFRLASRHRHYTNEPYRSDQTLLDDRGIIYLRHGEPDDRARFVSPQVEPNESWMYVWPEGKRIFHFVARDDVQDYKLVESLSDLFPDLAIQWEAQGRLPPIAQDLYDSRAALDQTYRRIAQSPTAQGTILANERSAGRRAIRLGTTTDSYPLRFRQRLQSRVQLYAVGGPDGGARGLLVFALPAARLTGRLGAGGVRYPVEIRVATLDAQASVMRLDTVRAFQAAGPLAGDQVLSGFVVFPVPADTLDLRVALLEPGGPAGDVMNVTEFEVPDFGVPHLVLSDLVLGDRTSELEWIVSGDTVPLSPGGAYVQGGAAELYYELHGLPPGTRYRARVEVRGKRGRSIFAWIGRLFGGGAPVAFSFDGVTTVEPQHARQTVALAPLEPGDYILTLTVEDLDGGRRESREVPLRVVDR